MIILTLSLFLHENIVIIKIRLKETTKIGIMKSIFSIIIFCIILFFYLHLNYHLKTSNDLEVYEVDEPSKEKLEEVCDLRQPVLFLYKNEKVIETCNFKSFQKTYGAFDMKIRNVKDHESEVTVTDICIPITLNQVVDIFKNDKESRYITENNHEFIEETGINKTFKSSDGFLRPPMVSKCMYDVMSGSSGTQTPLRYELNYRNYYLVTHGRIKMRLIPPSANKYLLPILDYDNFEFRSPINPWNPEPAHQLNFNKIKTMDVELCSGQIIYIPAYWWFSMEFDSTTDELSSICSFKYRTYMNTLSIFDKICMSFLQQQNTKCDAVEKKIIANEK
ncbi:MAG: hypothetical protein FJX80_15840 [Bacteroidetes bacterium]|jgi:hypothetical protein|nr:hypothetical protein [Bacteroidota bacterium]